MPSAISDYGAATWSGILVGVGALPNPFYVALCTSEPGTGWTGTQLATVEPADPGYARISIGTGSANWTLSGNGYVSNANALTFGTPTDTWGSITHFALTDALTGGNLWCFGEYASPPAIAPNFSAQIPAGGIVLALANLVASIAG